MIEEMLLKEQITNYFRWKKDLTGFTQQLSPDEDISKKEAIDVTENE